MATYSSGAWMSAAEMNEERMELMAAPPSGWHELAYVRRHPVYGYEPTAFYTHLYRPVKMGAGSSGSLSYSGKHGGSKSLNNVQLPLPPPPGVRPHHQFLGGGFPQGVIAAGGAGPPGGGGGGGAAAVAAAHAGLLAVPPVGGGGENKTNEFMLYTESDDSDDDCAELGELNQGRRAALNCDRISVNFADCLTSREMGMSRLGGGKFFTSRLNSEYGTRHMLSNSLLKETPVTVPNMNKVFCSQWLSDRQVVFGTKCNKLMVYDVNSKFMDQIPSLQCSENSQAYGTTDSGIHAIEINPSGTLLATGAKNANSIAVYRLPTLDPICVGENAHNDWIFDLTWLDDQFLVSGSRDGHVALWRVTDELIEQVISSDIPTYAYTTPLIRKPCKMAEKVRSMCFNTRLSELAVISTNGFIHCFNALRFKQTMSKKLPHNKDNVCMAVNDDLQLYAVGSKGHTDLLDARTLQRVGKSISPRGGNSNGANGIRSVSFRGNILTIGTAIGTMLFWDLRAEKFLDTAPNGNRIATLKASKGWLQRAYDEGGGGYFPAMHGGDQSFKLPAIYTHCYDQSGTRLFAAGGPLAVEHCGNYVALFQ